MKAVTSDREVPTRPARDRIVTPPSRPRAVTRGRRWWRLCRHGSPWNLHTAAYPSRFSKRPRCSAGRARRVEIDGERARQRPAHPARRVSGNLAPDRTGHGDPGEASGLLRLPLELIIHPAFPPARRTTACPAASVSALLICARGLGRRRSLGGCALHGRHGRSEFPARRRHLCRRPARRAPATAGGLALPLESALRIGPEHPPAAGFCPDIAECVARQLKRRPRRTATCCCLCSTFPRCFRSVRRATCRPMAAASAWASTVDAVRQKDDGFEVTAEGERFQPRQSWPCRRTGPRALLSANAGTRGNRTD